MTQTNNEREALKKALLELECYKGEILLDGNRPNDLRDLNETILIVKSAIAQSEQQEAVAEVRLDENNMKYIHWYKPWVHVLSSNSKLYLSPPKQAIPDGWKLVRIEPSDDHLKSMGIRSDHGLGVDGYYDTKPIQFGASHAQRMESAIREMRQLYEEAIGEGFYKLPAPTNTEVGE